VSATLASSVAATITAPAAAASTANLPLELGLRPFRPRLPWLNGDLQTLRDSLRPLRLPRDTGVPLEFDVGGGDQLLAIVDQPLPGGQALIGSTVPPCSLPLGLVVLMHGLGGSSDREGLRRMGLTLQRAGFAVLRLNMRGAGPGRSLARGTTAARCNSDLLPALHQARQLAEQLAPGGRPLLGMGISLGGTMLLNALLSDAGERRGAGLNPMRPLLDALVCISSPLDLEACSRQIERPRNRFYERWLLHRLLEQTQADPFGLAERERMALAGRGPGGPLRSIRGFDAAITAPRWGYSSVQEYYRKASPLAGLLAQLERPAAAAAALLQRPLLPPTLLLHAADDPWVPVAATERLAQACRPGAGAASQAQPLQVLITPRGGHNGFHACCDPVTGAGGCWGDRLTARWLLRWIDASAGAAAGRLSADPG
jgi:predicted alpha/beta-fold hydrolase